MSSFALRCDRCHHYLSEATEPMQLVALFKPAALGAVPKTHPAEKRARCRSCGYVNIFNPVERNEPLTPSWRHGIVLKQA